MATFSQPRFLDHMEQTLHLHNDPADLARIEAALEALASAGALTAAQCGDARLVLEEAFTNIVKYAHTDRRRDHPVDVKITAGPERLELELIDDGWDFDPFAKKVDQLERPFAERADGLMGVPLIRALMDECGHAYRDGHNHLTLRKRIGFSL